ncbi:MAG: IS1634 family transposase [Actinomycetota bacterium]|nr:IS1634 family transposase [Actinomycetota bacterium]
MHVATTTRRHGDRVYTTTLLRQSYREGGKVRHRTLANLSHLPEETVELVKASLAGTSFVRRDAALVTLRSLPHGDVAAVWGLAEKLGFKELLGPPCRERDVALALICSQVVEPTSKASYPTWWVDRTLGVDLSIAGIHTDEVYEAMDWLYSRKEAIEEALVARHFTDGSLVCYDLSSSWVEGRHNELAAFGHSRDQKRSKRQIEYGVVATTEGLPCAIEVFSGNTSDPKSFEKIVEVVETRFRLERVCFVGDRGMITSARVAALKAHGAMDWVTALRATEIKKLVASGVVQPSLFDEVNLAEITHPDYEGERLIACRNPFLAQERARKRHELLAATEANLEKLKAQVDAGRLRDPGKIGLRAGRVVNRHKMAKHFHLEIAEGRFSFSRKLEAITAEAEMDGIYVIRTSLPKERSSAHDVVKTYKSLANLERNCFQHMKTVDVEIRPIRHRLADRVRCHAFICMLGAHLTWHLRRAWAPLTFTDETPPERADPVAPATRSAAASSKAARRAQPDGTVLRTFQGLLDHLATLTRNTSKVRGTDATFDQLTEPTSTQQKAFELLGIPIPMRIV